MLDNATTPYPVTFEARSPSRYRRVQVLFRLLLLAGVGVVHQTLGGIFGALYLFLPAAAAIFVSRNKGSGFRSDDARFVAALLDWVVAFYAYVLYVTDRFPLGAADRQSRLSVSPSGTPNVGSALARLATTLPHAVVLCVLGIAAAFVAFASTIAVLFTERCPEGLHSFQRDIVAWIGRVLAYHSSLVEAYPPFTLESTSESPARG